MYYDDCGICGHNGKHHNLYGCDLQGCDCTRKGPGYGDGNDD